MRSTSSSSSVPRSARALCGVLAAEPSCSRASSVQEHLGEVGLRTAAAAAAAAAAGDSSSALPRPRKQHGVPSYAGSADGGEEDLDGAGGTGCRRERPSQFHRDAKTNPRQDQGAHSMHSKQQDSEQYAAIPVHPAIPVKHVRQAWYTGTVDYVSGRRAD